MWIEQQAQRGTPLPDVVEVDQVSPRGGQFALRWDGKWGDQGGIVALRGNAKRARALSLYLGDKVWRFADAPLLFLWLQS